MLLNCLVFIYHFQLNITRNLSAYSKTRIYCEITYKIYMCVFQTQLSRWFFS